MPPSQIGVVLKLCKMDSLEKLDEGNLRLLCVNFAMSSKPSLYFCNLNFLLHLFSCGGCTQACRGQRVGSLLSLWALESNSGHQACMVNAFTH